MVERRLQMVSLRLQQSLQTERGVEIYQEEEEPVYQERRIEMVGEGG